MTQMTIDIDGFQQLKGLIMAAETVSDEDRELYLGALESGEISDELRIKIADALDREADYHEQEGKNEAEAANEQSAQETVSRDEAWKDEESMLEAFGHEQDKIITDYEGLMTKIEIDTDKAIESDARGGETDEIAALRQTLSGGSPKA